MICNKSDFFDYLKADKIALGYDRVNKPKLFLNSIWKFERLLRKCEYYQNCKKGPINHLILKFLKFRFIKSSLKLGFSIPLNVFGKGLSIAHYGPIVVSHESKIGDFCRIHEGVTIGVTGDAYWGKQKEKAPVIGNNVFLGSGCKIIGEVFIADNVVIGANAVVVKSIYQEGTTWGGVPAKLISNNNSTFFIKNRY